jgi:hypothetical protein
LTLAVSNSTIINSRPKRAFETLLLLLLVCHISHFLLLLLDTWE